MKVDQPNMREVEFDCPWAGHLLTDMLVVRNSAVPNLIGQLCVKCGCMIYRLVAQSQLVGPGGEPLPAA